MMTFSPKKSQFYFMCNKCDYYTCSKKDYSKHCFTRKHTNGYYDDQNDDFFSQKIPIKFNQCECGKMYKHKQGLSLHKKTCLINEPPNVKNVEIKMLTELVKELTLHNQDLTDKIVDICKSSLANNISNNNIISNSHINSHNKTFNLQLFLNETCKDAMNISEFVDSIKLELSDLMELGEIGYVEGMSNLIVKNLNALNETERPIHCTDKKREIFYIKDEDKWEKEDEHKKKLRKIIFKISNKNIKLLQSYKELHPGCNFSESKFSDQYSKLVIEAMGGGGNNDLEKENKIIRNIAKIVTIDKLPEEIQTI